MVLLNINNFWSIQTIDGTLTDTTTLDLSGSVSNGNDLLPRSPELEPYHQKKFSVIPCTPFF